MKLEGSSQIFTLLLRLQVQKDILLKALNGEIVYPV